MQEALLASVVYLGAKLYLSSRHSQGEQKERAGPREILPPSSGAARLNESTPEYKSTSLMRFSVEIPKKFIGKIAKTSAILLRLHDIPFVFRGARVILMMFHCHMLEKL